MGRNRSLIALILVGTWGPLSAGCEALDEGVKNQGVDVRVAALTSDANGRIYAVYAEGRSGEVRVATRTSGGWRHSFLARANPNFIHLGPVSGGVLQGIYDDQGSVRFFSGAGSSWSDEVVPALEGPRLNPLEQTWTCFDPSAAVLGGGTLIVGGGMVAPTAAPSGTALYSRSPSGWTIAGTPVTAGATFAAAMDSSGETIILAREDEGLASYTQGPTGWTRFPIDAPAMGWGQRENRFVVDGSKFVHLCSGPLYGFGRESTWTWTWFDSDGETADPCLGIGVHPDGRAFVLLDAGLYEEDGNGGWQYSSIETRHGGGCVPTWLFTEGPFRIHTVGTGLYWKVVGEDPYPWRDLRYEYWENGQWYEETIDG